MNKGIVAAIGAYVAWGVLPVYWKSLAHVSEWQSLSHRGVWSCLLLVLIIVLTRQWRTFRQTAFTLHALRVYLTASVLIGINWLIYIWSVNAGFLIETSLGYFINPLFSVLLGVIIFRERLRLGQWVSVGLAAGGVLYLTMVYGALPWIALTLALSFGLYGLVKKTAPLNSLFGVTLETGVLMLPALVYIFYIDAIGEGVFLHAGTLIDVLLIGTGLITIIPLLLFASAARKIPLSLIGILQYIAPTLQFLLGVVVYNEPFTQTRFIGFAIVWLALIVFALEGWLVRRTQTVAVIAE